MQARLALLTEIIRSEDSFFRSAFRGLATVSHISQYMAMRTQFYALMQDVIPHVADDESEEVPSGQFHIHIPAGWGEPVPIQATAAQINSVLVDIPAIRELTSCAICQEANVSRDATHCIELRACHHQFHTACIREWFQQSVRCPVCRNDIRESGTEES